jgi:hypothetical protein
MKRTIIAAFPLLFFGLAALASPPKIAERSADAIAGTATNTPALAGERPVSSPAYAPPQGYRVNAVAASDGHDFLIAWIDTLRNRASDMHIYATRVSASGQVLDAFNTRLPTDDHHVSRLNVVYTGTSYLIIWRDEELASLLAVRINRDGLLLDGSPRKLADGGSPLNTGTASNGNRTVIVYSGPAGVLMKIVLDRDANIVDGPAPLTNPAGPVSENAMIASNGHGFLVLRARTGSTSSTILNASGAVVSSAPAFTNFPGSVSLLDLASDGETYVAITGTGNITAQRFGAAGETLESSIIPLLQIGTGFAFSSGSYLLMDGDPLGHTLGLRRLDRTGHPVGDYTPFATAPSFSATAALASNGSDAFAGWVEWQPRNQLFNGAVINSQSLIASTATPIIRAAKTQTSPAAASSGVNTAIVWIEDDGTYAGRLSASGQMLDGTGIRVGERSITEPKIVFDGANYLIAWTEQQAPPVSTTSVKLARLAPESGALLDAHGITAANTNCGFGLTLATGGPATLLAWSDCGQVSATTVAKNLTLGPAITVTPSQTLTGAISSAWNGQEWLLAWEHKVPNDLFFDFPSYDNLIDAARVSASLTLLDPAPIVLSSHRGANAPSVASDGDGFLVAWTDTTEATDPSRVMAQRVSSDGSTLADANGVRLAAGRARSTVWDGAQYDVALSSAGSPHTIYVTHVASRGAIESVLPLMVISDRTDPDASLIVSAPGKVSVVYTRIGTEPEYGDVDRAFVAAPRTIRGRAAGGH